MPDHQHPSPAGDELVERLKRELALAQTMWKVARDDVAKEFKAAIRFAKIADQQKTRADRAEAALASERSARQAAEAERERLREAVKPFLAAFDAAEARYRERGGDPQWFGDNAAWFDVKPSLIVKGRQVVPTELHAITLKGPYRRLRALASQQEGADDQAR